MLMLNRVLFSAAALLLLVSGATAQEFRATISGTIVDSSGAAIPGVTVTATETRTGARSVVVSDASGQYVAPFLAPGDYDLTAELSGFKQYTRRALHLASGSHPILDIRLDIGAVSESVQVNAEAPLVNAANAVVGQIVTT